MHCKYSISAVLALALSAFAADMSGALKAAPALKNADSAKNAAALNARAKVDSIKAAAAMAAKKAADSAKAAAEAAAKKAADSARAAAEALTKAKKDTAKPAAPAPSSQAQVIPAPEPAKTAPAGCGLAKIAFGTGVENRELQGEAAEFEASVNRVSCWVRLACGSGPIKVRHVWTKDGAKTQDVSLSCQSASGRVWSNAPVTSGKWKVEVLKETGESMGSGEFTVK